MVSFEERFDDLYIIVNGVAMSNGDAGLRIVKFADSLYLVNIDNFEYYKDMMDVRVRDIPESVVSISGLMSENKMSGSFGVSIYRHAYYPSEFEISTVCKFVEEGGNGASLIRYMSAISDVIGTDVKYNNFFAKIGRSGLVVGAVYLASVFVVGDTIKTFSDKISEIHDDAMNLIGESEKDEEEGDSGSVTLSVEFPIPIKDACIQYLSSFGQFLRDVGIENTTDIHNSPFHVLFSVNPTDPAIALDKIREALNVYCSLPMSDSVYSVNPLTESIAAQRLAANVQHLNGQLMLARAELQLKDATIRTLQTAQLLTEECIYNIVIKALEKHGERDRISVFGELGAVRPLEVPGGEINLPEIARRLNLTKNLNPAQAIEYVKSLFTKPDEQATRTTEIILRLETENLSSPDDRDDK